MTKYYTRTGDDGTTSLLGKERVTKFDLRMEALGALDELSAVLGLVRSHLQYAPYQQKIVELQRNLYLLMSEVAASPENAEKFIRITAELVNELETEIDHISLEVEVPQGFIIPGETPASAFMAFARTIARRAERRVVELHAHGELKNEQLLCYVNRLSSLLFIMELDLIQNEAAKKPTMSKEKPA